MVVAGEAADEPEVLRGMKFPRRLSATLVLALGVAGEQRRRRGRVAGGRTGEFSHCA